MPSKVVQAGESDRARQVRHKRADTVRAVATSRQRPMFRAELTDNSDDDVDMTGEDEDSVQSDEESDDEIDDAADQDDLLDEDEESLEEMEASDDGGVDVDDGANAQPSNRAAERAKVRREMADVSFGALVAAQDGLDNAALNSESDDDGHSAGSDSEDDDDDDKVHTAPRKRGPSDDVDLEQSLPPISSLSTRAEKEAALAAARRLVRDAARETRSAGKRPRREHKHAPQELSASRRVGRARPAVEVAKIERRDPRFDAATNRQGDNGASSGVNDRRYDFLKDYRRDEMASLKQAIARERDADEKDRLQLALKAMTSRNDTRIERERQQEVEQQHRRRERQLAKETGKRPYYLKQSALREAALKDKYDKLKASGSSVEKYVEKKRRKRAQKDKRSLPRLG